MNKFENRLISNWFRFFLLYAICYFVARSNATTLSLSQLPSLLRFQHICCCYRQRRFFSRFILFAWIPFFFGKFIALCTQCLAGLEEKWFSITCKWTANTYRKMNNKTNSFFLWCDSMFCGFIPYFCLLFNCLLAFVQVNLIH